jgi:hypothetical protein
MNFRASKLIMAFTVTIAGVIASLVIQHRSEANIHENNKLLDRQDNQLAGLTAAHELLSNKVAEVNISLPDGAIHELERLTVEAARLREQTNELGKKLAQSQDSRKLLGTPTLPPGSTKYTPDEYARQQEMSAGKRQDAEILSKAFYDYYRTHENQFPSSLDQLAQYLAENNLTLTGTNDFELIYPWPQEDLTNFPTQMLAVIREQQAWQAPSGRWARVYGMLTVPPRVVEADDNFQSYEAQHVFMPPTVDPSGQ